MTGRSPGARRALAAGLLLFIALLALGIVPRVLRRRELLADVGTRADGAPVVSVFEARRAANASQIELPGSVVGLHETQVYARTNGYMKRGLVEIGQRVRKGQLLGELETPEQDQEMSQSRAALAQAEAQLALTRTTLDRWEKLVPQGAATRQELDDKRGAFNVAKANADAVQANVHRLEELKRFARVTAPFAGVITARTVDVGALVSSGTTAGSRGLFSLAQIDSVRVFVNVPQTNVASIAPGLPADVAVQELGGVVFHGRVARSANALDPSTRTLLTQVEVANPSLKLLPGMYAQVRFRSTRASPPLLIPANALLIRADGPQVAVVRPDGRVHLQRVELGRDFGNEVEIASGLDDHAMVIVNPSDEVMEGAMVKASPIVRAKE